MRPPPLGSTPYAVPPEITLAEFEARIAPETDEIAAAFNAEGRLVLAPRRGDSSEVRFVPEEASSLEGTVVTHNHPLGGLLSGEDAAFASDFDLAEMRVVQPAGVVYSLRRPQNGWPEGDPMLLAAKRCVKVILEEKAWRLTAGLPKMTRNEAINSMFEDQRNAFSGIGVELKRSSLWQ